MPVFEYKGFDAQGGAAAGLIDADNGKSARLKLRRQGVFPTEVKEQSGAATTGEGLNREIDFAAYFERVTLRDISNLTAQLAVLVGASVPLSEALQALVDQTEKGKLKIVLSNIREQVNEGVTLGDAMADHPKVFDTLYLSMVRAGERSGALAEVLDRLSKFAEEAVKLQGQLVSALAYPILMAGVGGLMIVGIFVGILPQMRTMFASFAGGESDLPFITRMVFFFGDMLTGWPIFVVMGIAAVLFFAYRSWVSTPKGRMKVDGWKLSLPAIGRMNRMIAISRFCRTLGTLLISGVPIITALNIVRDVLGNEVLSEVIQQASVNIQEGQSIAGPLKASGQFPPMVIHMIKVGERTGELERMLNLIADAYEAEVDTAVKAFTSVLGPLTIVIMGGVVGTVALGLLLPMQQLSNAIR